MTNVASITKNYLWLLPHASTANNPITILEGTKKCLEHRRKITGDNDRILKEHEVKECWDEWCINWMQTQNCLLNRCKKNLTKKQKMKMYKRTISLFKAYLRRTMGSNIFVFAMIQCGLYCDASSSSDVATEHEKVINKVDELIMMVKEAKNKDHGNMAVSLRRCLVHGMAMNMMKRRLAFVDTCGN